MAIDQGEPTFRGMEFVAREYLVYGAEGIKQLREDLRSRRRPPMLDRFTVELYSVLTGDLPEPTKVVNKALSDADIQVSYTDSGLLQELNTLWAELDLETPEVEGGVGVAARRRKQHLWVDGDPTVAMRTWISPLYLVLFICGAVVSLVSWQVASHTGGIVRGLFWFITLVGFAAGVIGGGALYLRRARYQDPDAFLPKPKDSRR